MKVSKLVGIVLFLCLIAPAIGVLFFLWRFDEASGIWWEGALFWFLLLVLPWTGIAYIGYALIHHIRQTKN